ncbi:condensation domain-containing protein [Inconstantimicrobium porci]|uniref:condensation domain-containing protein n=1 Tax=Inconstantimicrobium porci TaxID=2652291 RepID=UPI0012B33B88|nr:condensation domain-containing protein [Inconstantimicrobium porci]
MKKVKLKCCKNWNICTSLWFKEDIDIDLLKKALLISLNRIDALNIHLTEINKNIKQYLSDEKYRDIEVLDYSDKSIEEIKQEFNKRACVEMKWKDCNLIDVVIAKVPENRVALCVVVNHVIADAWGLTVFMKDALEVYLSLREGKDLPEKPASFLKVIEEELKYTDSQKMKDDEEYWKSVFDEAPSYSSVNRKNVGKKYGRISLDFTSTAKIITLPKEEVQVVNDYCKKNRISPQVLFILAMYCYLSMLNNKDELLINNALSI